MKVLNFKNWHKLNEQAKTPAGVFSDHADEVAFKLMQAFAGPGTSEQVIYDIASKYSHNAPGFLKKVEARFNERNTNLRKPQGTLLDQIRNEFGIWDSPGKVENVLNAFGYDRSDLN